ncbi:MAG: sigma-70 family RNA polymerase sigma factor [Planctomycetota bacterium]|nr:sigma-70 family RNA polymerase sigma factor [Planctomycetota bacterium]
MRRPASKEAEVGGQSRRSIEDERTLERIRSGDRDAFGDLVERYQERLHRVLVRISDDHHDAEDLLQEVFVKAYRALDRFAGESQLFTWLYRIAINTALSHRRKGRGRPRPVSLEQGRNEGGALPELPDTRRGAPAELEAAEEIDQVRRAIASLDDDHRTVVVLKDIEGLRYEEIAEIIGCPRGTVKSRIHRARMAIRDRLQK